jgi:hypothetical protein
VGDIAVVAIYKENTAAITAPDGTWTQKAWLNTSATSRGSLAVYWKRLTAADTGSYTFTWTGSAWREAWCGLFSGRAGSGDPFDDFGTAENTTSGTTLNVSASPAAAAGDAVGFWTNFSGGTNFTPPTNYTERFDGDVLTADTRDNIASGSTGSISASANHSSFIKAFLGVLAVAGGGTFAALAGDAPADGGTATFTGGTFTTLVGDAPAAGGSAKFTGNPLAPLVTDVSADGRSLIDQNGQPIIPLFDTIWPMIQQAGNTARNGGSATWDQDIDFWVTTRASQGWNALKFNMFGQTVNGAPNNDSRTWDTIFPFGASGSGTSNANPSSGQIAAYWQRVDYILDACATAGLTAFIHIFYADDVDSGLMSGKATSEFQALGTFLGNRYKDKPGIVWVIGGDYFDTFQTQIKALRTNMIAAGDAHPWTVQNWANQASNDWTTSRKDNTGATQQLGTDIADINASYIYDPTYLSAAAAWAETPTIPTIWYDGYYDQGTGDQLQQRRYVGWSLSYGQWGCQFGSEDLWNQPSGWRGNVSSPDATVTQIIAMRNAVAAINGWQTLIPDLSSTFITAGRSTGNNFVTGSLAADGSLALIYIPVASSAITVDTTQMQAGYTVTWIDPVNGATTAGTPGTSFSKGNNSGGSTDWFLLLAAPTSSPGTFTTTTGDSTAAGGSATFTSTATFTTVVGDSPAAGGTVSMTGASTFAALAGDAPAAGGVASFTATATFAAAAGDAPASGGSTTLTGAATFAATVGDGPADGGLVTMTGAAVLAATTGDAPADGGQATMTGQATGTFTASTGDAPADGGSATFTGQAVGTFTASTGDAPADGGAAAFTAAALFTTAVGDGPASGGSASFVAGAIATLTGLTGDAPADGGAATLSGAAVFATVVGQAQVDGGTATLVAGVAATFTATTGNGPAGGGTAAFTGTALFTALVGDSVADGQAAAFTGGVGAIFTTGTGNGPADGGTAAFTAEAIFTALGGNSPADGTVAAMYGQDINMFGPADNPVAYLVHNTYSADLVHSTFSADLVHNTYSADLVHRTT